MQEDKPDHIDHDIETHKPRRDSALDRGTRGGAEQDEAVPGVRGAYMFYFRRILPKLGSWISGDRDGAYDYLPASVMAFPEGEAFLDLMREAGLEKLRCERQTFGIASIYRGDKPLRSRAD